MITFCIPSKNNLRYLKNSVNSILQNSSVQNEIIVYVDSDNDGTKEWLDEKGIKYLVNETDSPKGIAYGYNRCIEAATTQIVCMFHADMYMAKGFDTAILKYLKPLSVVSGTRIEPPLHPMGSEKIIRDFGMYPEDFKKEEFDNFVSKSQKIYEGRTTNGIFAPWAVYKEDITSIGMHDEYLHSYHEDSDIFNRFILNGYEIIQTWEGFVYHLTCRGGQFQDGVEQITKNEQFHKMKSNSFRNYIRKWGHFVKNDEYQHPIIPPKYQIVFVVKNCNLSILELLEPWCDKIYVDEKFEIGRAWDYVEMESINTHFDLSKKVITNSEPNENDIIIHFDANKITNQSFQIIQNIQEIFEDSGEVGTFELDIFNITINKMEEFQYRLVNVSDRYYTEKLK